ncbi:MAG: hypothetical protein OYH76_20155 [Defluviicoccus sp.]|nr:hypothetical protein [Defluviicoccus sp.]MDE0278216.1 hypothetical protein [Defluviicoccus sp.]
MLKHSDLDTFVELVRIAEREAKPSPAINPDKVLRGEAPAAVLLHRNELSRLRCSLKIASVAGDAPDSVHRILYTIVQDLSPEGFIYLPLSCSKQWLGAIAWALHHPATSASDYPPHPGRDRQWAVGNACRALRNRGHRVDIGTLGPGIDAATRVRIARKVDSLFARIGGIDAAEQLFRILRDTRKRHAGMWLFGNVPTPVDQLPQPALPTGWLLSLALRNIHASPTTVEPETDWNSAIGLATDFAASSDCQRYNRFDGFTLDAPDFLPALTESLTWRELFTLPQIPPSVLPTLRNAFSRIDWPTGTDDLRRDVDQLFGELDLLLTNLRDDGLTLMPRGIARFDFPLLWIHGGAPRDGVNAKYLDPFGEHPRDHDPYVFFEAGDRRIAVLPSSLTVAAGCEAIFRLIWTSAERASASQIVADTIEKSVAIAGRTHTARVWERAHYRADGADLEIDLAVRDGDEIILFESKAKSLTSKARSSDMMAFVDDYTKSFLALLGQLVRHDRNIKRGLTPLTEDGDDPGALRVAMVAVSPLSFGPASDHVLTNALMHAIAGARLESVDGDPDRVRILEAFNKSVRRSVDIIDGIAPRQDGKVDMVRYLMQVSWLDLGQLLYALHRGRSLPHAMSAMRHLTFGTRDFWTEVALADREGLITQNWHPVSEVAPTC